MDIEEVLSRAAISDLVVRYNSNSDSGRFAQVRDLFVDEAVMEIGAAGDEPVVHDGIDAIMGMFAGASERVGTADRSGAESPPPAGPAYIRHFTATHQIDVETGDRASGRCYFAVVLPHGLDHWGRYVDNYVRRDDSWRFSRRRVIVDGGVEDSWYHSAR